MKIKIWMLIFLLSTVVISAQKEAYYNRKSLLQTLQKTGISDISAVNEIVITDSLYSVNNLKGKYFTITNNNASQHRYIYIGRVNCCRAGGCSISNHQPKDEAYEYFDYFILFDKNKTVSALKIFNYQAAHGQEITSKGWLNQFVGYDGKKLLQVDKNIDAIAGATISVYALTHDVELKTRILKIIQP